MGEKLRTIAEEVQTILPFGGWAPGDYICSQCQSCGLTFSGDKRSAQCLPCAVMGLKRLAEDRAAAIRDARSEWSDHLEALLVEAGETLRPFGTVAALIDRYFADTSDEQTFTSGAAWRDKDGNGRTLVHGDFRKASDLASRISDMLEKRR